MASAPPRPSSQSRSSQRNYEAQQSSPTRAEAESTSVHSEDSETVILNKSPSSSSRSNILSRQTSHQASAPALQLEDPRKCWICFSDETEDTPMSSEWRSPCPCALTAHEACLLDWIADMEAPSRRRETGSAKKKITCPQCKSEIKLDRPRYLTVEAVRFLEKATSLATIPTIATILGYTVYEACYMHGISTIYLIFGMRDGATLLKPLQRQLSFGENSVFFNAVAKNISNWRMNTGLPFIPGVLILARTRWADSLLPILPMFYFATASHTEELIDVGHWSPSAALSFGVLPYLRSAYNLYYDVVWKPHMDRWLQEVRPRLGEDENDRLANNDQPAPEELAPAEDDNLLAFDINLVVEEVEEEEQEQAAADEEAPPFDAPPLDMLPDPALAAGPQAEDAAPAPHVPRQGNGERNVRQNLAISTGVIADTVLGALFFPSIAAAVGELLRVSLPKSWVVVPNSGKATGILQARWGRSLVGGCAFVVMRDALMIYVRWKMAQSHRRRKVLNYDKSKGQASAKMESS